MDIYALLQTKPHDHSYVKIYLDFIEKCKLENSMKSKEDMKDSHEHHILPKAKDLFPEYKDFNQFPRNKITLTHGQHYDAHHLLWKLFGKSQAQAFCCMQGKSSIKQIDNEMTADEYVELLKDRKKFIRETKICDQTIYVFENIESGEEFIGKRFEFSDKYNTSVKSLFKNNTRQTEKGWWVKFSIDENGDKIPRYSNDYFDPKPISEHTRSLLSEKFKNTAIYKDKNGDVFRCSTSDPNVVSGEYTSVFKGKIVTDESKKLMSESATKKKEINEETRNKMSKSHTGKKLTRESIENRTLARTDKNIYKFFNVDTNQTMECTRKEFSKFLNAKISRIFKGETIKRWKLFD